MSEVRGQRWRWSVKSLHSLESMGPLHHRHVLQTQTLSESHIYEFLLRFFHQIGIELNHWPMVPVLILNALSSQVAESSYL